MFSALPFAYLQPILDCTRDAMFIAKIDNEIGVGHRIVLVNDAFSRLTGFGLDEIGGKPPIFLCGPRTEVESINRLKSAFQGRQKKTLKILAYRKDGTNFACDVAVHPLIDGDDADFVIAVLSDTGSKKADAEADGSRPNNLESLVDTMDKAVLIHQNKQPLLVNAAYLDLFGYTSRAQALREISPLMNLELGRVSAGKLPYCDLLRTDGQALRVTVRQQIIPWNGTDAEMLTFSRISASAPPAGRDKTPNRSSNGLDDALLMRELLDSLPVAVAHKTRDLRFTYVNETFAKWVDSTPEEIVGRHVSHVRNEAHYQLMKDRRADVFNGKVVQYVTKCEFPGRGMCDLLTTLVPRVEPDGAIESYSSLSQDITDLMEVERNLSQREEQLRLVMDSVPALISYRDRNLYYKYVNQPYADWYGVRREEIIGRHMTDFLGLVEFRKLKPCIDRVLAGEKFRDTYDMSSSDTRRPPLSVDFVPHKDENGHVLGFFALAQKTMAEDAQQSRSPAADPRVHDATESIQPGSK